MNSESIFPDSQINADQRQTNVRIELELIPFGQVRIKETIRFPKALVEEEPAFPHYPYAFPSETATSVWLPVK